MRGWLQQNERALRTIAIALAALIVLFEWGRIIAKPRGDFYMHYEFARRLWDGQFMYEAFADLERLHWPYLPFWGMAHFPALLLPLGAAQAVVFPLGIAALVLLFIVLNRLTRAHLPLAPKRHFWVVAAALALASRFVLRDMSECCVNTALVTLSWLGVYLWIKEKELLGGLSLGFAIALKLTPGVFLLYFAWKRQWKMAVATTLAAGLFTLAPIIVMGPSSYEEHVRDWVGGVGTLTPDARRSTNLSLRLAVERYTMHLPPDDYGRIDHPLFKDMLDFAPRTAHAIARAVALALIGVLAYATRHRIRNRGDERVLWECAAISLALLLLSPVTWEQHAVGVIPALYLLVRSRFVRGPAAKWMRVVVVVYVITCLGLNRGVLGRDLNYLMLSYRLIAFSLLALLAVVVVKAGRLPGAGTK